MKKSINRKKLEGTFRGDRSREAPVISISGIPQPQDYLTKEGKDIYQMLCRWVKNNDALAEIDSLVVSAAAQSFYTYAIAALEVNKKKPFQTFKTGASAVSGAYSVLKSELSNIIKFSRLFGRDNASRERLMSFAKVKVEEDEFKEFIKNG